MPLKEGNNQKDVGSNIGELVKSGWPQKQAEAIALSYSRRGKKKPKVAGKATASKKPGPKMMSDEDGDE